MQMNNIKLSIIIPIYNAYTSLNKCVSSLINQPNIEIILVDDGSRDGSGELCDKLSHENGNVKVFHQPNLGPSKARNSGLKLVSGNYFCFLDSDDWLDKDYLDKSMVELEKNKVDILMTPYVREYGDTKEYNNIFDKTFITKDKKQSLEILRKLIGPVDNELRKPGRIENLNPVWGKFYKTSLFSNIRFIDRDKIAAEDLWFNICAFNLCNKCEFLSGTFYHYNKTNYSSIVHTYNHRFFDQYKELYKKIQEFIIKNQYAIIFNEALNNRIVINLISMFLNYSKEDNFFRARKYLIKIINDPIYSQPFKKFNYKEVPLFYKIFFFMCGLRLITFPLLGVKFFNKLGYRKQ